MAAAKTRKKTAKLPVTNQELVRIQDHMRRSVNILCSRSWTLVQYLGIKKSDVFQEAMLRLKKTSFEPGRATFKTFSNTIAKRALIDLLRDGLRRKKAVSGRLDSLPNELKEAAITQDSRKSGKQQHPGRRLDLSQETVLARVKMLKTSRSPTIAELNRQIIIRYYGLDGGPQQTQDALAKHFKLTEARVNQILKKGLAKLGKDPVIKSLKGWIAKE